MHFLTGAQFLLDLEIFFKLSVKIFLQKTFTGDSELPTKCVIVGNFICSPVYCHKLRLTSNDYFI